MRGAQGTFPTTLEQSSAEVELPAGSQASLPLALPEPPTAVFAHSDEIALSAWVHRTAWGLRVPAPAVEGREDNEVVITHAFTIGWLVRHTLDASSWRWWGQNQCHAGLTVIRCRVHGPPSILVGNDVTHLPAELRWTGFPDEHKP